MHHLKTIIARCSKLKLSIRHVTAILLAIGLSLHLQAQTLLPSIGLSAEPSDADVICEIPVFPDPIYGSSGTDYSGNGPAIGDTIPDFQFYSLDGTAFDALSPLQSGMPILMIAGSYTCPVFRSKIPVINQIDLLYGSQIQIYVVYTLEAHPDIDVSTYFGFVNTLTSNIDAGILYRQPLTYGDRKNILVDLLDSMYVSPPVLIDGPCNSWWTTFGPAPNNAYLIDTTGRVFSKHGWFDKYPDDILYDLDSLLYGSGGGGPDLGGHFTIDVDSIVEVYGAGGQTLAAHIMLENEESESALLNISRVPLFMPTDWATSICIDICLAPDQDFTQLLLPPHSTQDFTLYYYTDSLVTGTADSGMVRINFQNGFDPVNSVHVNFLGTTQNVGTSIAHETPADDTYDLQIGPNPCNGILHWQSTHANDQITLLDLRGRIILRQNTFGANSGNINLGHQHDGMYFAVFSSQQSVQIRPIQFISN